MPKLESSGHSRSPGQAPMLENWTAEGAPEAFITLLRESGWVLFPDVVEAPLLARIKSELEIAQRECRAIQLRNGVDTATDGTAHHVLASGGVFLEFLARLYLHPFVERFFEGKYIVNTYGGLENLRSAPSYVCNMHRDVRTFTGGLNLMLNMLIPLDDFTLENGATYLLTGSHRSDRRPDEAGFFRDADRACMKAGSIVLFDSNLWHAAGKNTTDFPRRALTLTFTKPYLKQQLDYPRLLGYERMNEFGDTLRQVLGYNARVPTTLDEWYRPKSERFYKPDQG